LAIAQRFALPVEGNPVTIAGLDVTVNAVVANVQLAAEVPLRVPERPVKKLVEGLEPGDPLRPSVSQNSSKSRS
jgi:hypothetical protein